MDVGREMAVMASDGDYDARGISARRPAVDTQRHIRGNGCRRVYAGFGRGVYVWLQILACVDLQAVLAAGIRKRGELIRCVKIRAICGQAPFLQRLLQIRNQIFGVFQTHRQAENSFACKSIPRIQLLLRGKFKRCFE